MSEPGQAPPSPLPWKVLGFMVVDADNNTVVTSTDATSDECGLVDVALIVEAVNTHAELQAEVARLQVARIGDTEIIGRWMCQCESAEAQLTEAIALIRDSWDMTAVEWIEAREKFLAHFDKQAKP